MENWNAFYKKMSGDLIDKIKLFHLNGAEAANFGRGKDGHIIPLSSSDAIWSKYVTPRAR